MSWSISEILKPFKNLSVVYYEDNTLLFVFKQYKKMEVAMLGTCAQNYY